MLSLSEKFDWNDNMPFAPNLTFILSYNCVFICGISHIHDKKESVQNDDNDQTKPSIADQLNWSIIF